jgi:hypothetical protein
MKPAIIVLILIAAIFAIILVVGAHQNSSQQTPHDPGSFHPPGWLSGMGQLIAPFSPKVKLGKNTFIFGTSPMSESVPSSTDEFRTATFRVTQGCRSVPQQSVKLDCSNIEIVYRSKGGEGHDQGLDSQTWKAKYDDPTRGSLVILKGGGALTFRCVGMPRCTVVLE